MLYYGIIHITAPLAYCKNRHTGMEFLSKNIVDMIKLAYSRYLIQQLKHVYLGKQVLLFLPEEQNLIITES